MTLSTQYQKILDHIENHKPKVIDPSKPPGSHDILKYREFWVSPTGNVYPATIGFGHEPVRQQIALHDKVDIYSIDESRGWIRIRSTYRGSSIGWATQKPTQRQIDVLWDLIMAFMKGNKDNKNNAAYLNEQYNKKLKEKHSESILVATGPLPKNIYPDDMPKKRVYNFYMSPEGVIYPAKKYGHGEVYEALTQAIYKSFEESEQKGNNLYDRGWLSGHAINGNGGYIETAGNPLKPTQRQLDAFFDMYLAFRTAERAGDNTAYFVMNTLRKELKPTGMKLAGVRLHTLATVRIPRTISPKNVAKKKQQGFFISPQGDIYPVTPTNHEDVSQALRYKFYPNAMAQGTLHYIEEKGWLGFHGWAVNREGFFTQATQKQLDALFDIYLNLKPVYPNGGEAMYYFVESLNKLHLDVRKDYNKTAIKHYRIRISSYNEHVASVRLKTISPKEVTKKEIYNFFLSPDGNIYPVKHGKHEEVSKQLREKFYPNETLQYIEEKGWLSFHTLDMHTQGYSSQATQKQIDTLFDIYLELKETSTYGDYFFSDYVESLKTLGIDVRKDYNKRGDASSCYHARIEHVATGIPRQVSPKDLPKKKIYNFWMSPTGTIYPTTRFGHDKLEDLLYKDRYTYGDTPVVRDFMGGGSLYSKNWLSAHWLNGASGSLETGAIERNDPNQLQLDALFDIFLVFLKVWKTDKDMNALYVLNHIKSFVKQYGMTLKIAKKSLSAGRIPKPITPKELAKKNILNFFLSPDGDIYPVKFTQHDKVSKALLKHFFPDEPDVQYIENKGWLSSHLLRIRDEGQRVKATQKQKDVLFDLYQNFRPPLTDKEPNDNYRLDYLSFPLRHFVESVDQFGVHLSKHHKKLLDKGHAEYGKSLPKRSSVSKLPRTISSETVAKKKEYNFFLSPDGDIYPVKYAEHDMISLVLRQKFYPEDIYGPNQLYIEAKGWLSSHALKIKDEGFNVKATQRQKDVLFDIYLAVKPIPEDDPKYLKESYRLPGMSANLEWFVKALYKFGVDVRRDYQKIRFAQTTHTASVPISTELGPYKHALHELMLDYADSAMVKQERLQETTFDVKALADDAEDIIGKTRETSALRHGKLTSAMFLKLLTALLEARNNADTDVWEVNFNLTRKLQDYGGSLEDVQTPDEIRKEFKENEEYLLTETTKISRVLEKEISAAVKRVKITMKGAGISNIVIKPDYMENAYGTSSVSVNPITSYQVYLNTKSRYQPSFTVFAKDNGKIDQLGDVLESGDTEFFPMVGELSPFYFDLVKEIEKPGSSKRAGKMLALYTARPTKDRRLYENGRKVPVSIFLTSDMDRAAGIAHDLGSNEVRDIWFVRISDKYLVQTLNTPRMQDYQVVGSGRFVPVKSLDLVWEGGSKRGSYKDTSPTSQTVIEIQGNLKKNFLQQHKLRAGNIEVFGAVSPDNTLLGGIAVRKAVGKYAKKVYASQGIFPDVTISQLYVDPSHRSKGLGKRLLNAVLQKYKVVALGTDNKKVHTNEEAILLYKHAGFRPVKKEQQSTFWIREG